MGATSQPNFASGETEIGVRHSRDIPSCCCPQNQRVGMSWFTWRVGRHLTAFSYMSAACVPLLLPITPKSNAALLTTSQFLCTLGNGVRARENVEAEDLGLSQRFGEVELKEEWQDEEFPRLLPEEVSSFEDPENSREGSQMGPLNTLALCGRRHMRKRLSPPELQLSLEKDSGDKEASPTHSTPSSPHGSSDLDVDDLETPSDSEQLDSGHEFEWEDDLPQTQGLRASEAAERLGQDCVWDVTGEDGHHWKVFQTGHRELRVDMTIIEPYKKVLSHGGYHGDGLNAVILFASCYLPRSSIPNYSYIMEHLFRYIVGTLELLVAENYLLVHLSGATCRAQVPPLSWMRQCYRTLDRRPSHSLLFNDYVPPEVLSQELCGIESLQGGPR
ncbi:bcl-2/adenovirus E1B 19 kDa-interacting protein 2-like protein isoform X2 [Macrotis lagotis]|uniref:bcl-2/adenovirus E1B 19 kDa-interacting protein 2-like protein isoform X2 n=1 Tax=Macrotis lagotis TaxID=92651 RepID=UPI003D68157E